MERCRQFLPMKISQPALLLVCLFAIVHMALGDDAIDLWLNFRVWIRGTRRIVPIFIMYMRDNAQTEWWVIIYNRNQVERE